MTERFNVAGALLVKLFGRPDIEHGEFAGRAARVRDIGVQQAMYGRVFFISLILTASLATALVYGWGGVLRVRRAGSTSAPSSPWRRCSTGSTGRSRRCRT